MMSYTVTMWPGPHVLPNVVSSSTEELRRMKKFYAETKPDMAAREKNIRNAWLTLVTNELRFREGST